ncbi:MAG: hypothetical protein GY814_20370 [Gammaproteobacteria bacterium]|nr:hypothetical protein [Gammaproteobacteria bacterium]
MVIEKGATFCPVLIYKDGDGEPIDNTGWTAKQEIRDTDDPDTVLDTLTEIDGLVLGGVDGTVTYNLTAARSIGYDWALGITDLFLNDGVKDHKLFYGSVQVLDRVTQV